MLATDVMEGCWCRFVNQETLDVAFFTLEHPMEGA